MNMGKQRIIYLLLAPVVIYLAFFTRSSRPWIPGFIAEYGGDTLWAAMVFMVLRIVFVKWEPWRAAALTLAISYLCELSQLYQAEWINQLRSNFWIHVLIGGTFVWSDIGCYSTGVLLALLGELGVRKLLAHKPESQTR
jgi:hypothetical protein